MSGQFGPNFDKAAPGASEKRATPPAPKIDAPTPSAESADSDLRGARRLRSARDSHATSRAKRERLVRLLLWGRRDQGKTAFLWALGHRLTTARTRGFRFSERRPSFQKHWALLDKQLKESWQRTTGEKEIKGGELELFQVRRDKVSSMLGGVEVDLQSMDIPGEQIAELGGYKQDAQTAKEVMSEIGHQVRTADACFIVARADEMLGDPGACSRQADFIRQSLNIISKEERASTRTAIVLTACDAIPDQEWRARLGFGGADFGDGVLPAQSAPEPSEPARRQAARAFLVERDRLIAEGLEQFSDLEVFAVSSWGEAPAEDGSGRKSVAHAVPRFVEEPVAWVLEAEFRRREAAQRARRMRRLASAAAALAIASALVAQLLVAPLVGAFEPGAVVAALAPEAGSLPAVALEWQRDASRPALVSAAVSHARAGRDAAASEALAALQQLDAERYHFSRAYLEVSRIRYAKWRSSAPVTPSARDEVEYISEQASEAEGSLDRYGQSVMRLRALLARVRSVASPDDAATAEIYGLLGADRLLAMQHGGDLMSSLWAQWVAVGLEPAALPSVFQRLDEAATLVATPEWHDLLRTAAPVLAAVAFDEIIRNDAGALVRLLRWHRDDALVSGIVDDGIRAAYERGVGKGAQDRGARSSALAREFALCFSQNSWVAGALPDFLFEVIDVLVAAREEAAILKIDPKSVAGAAADGGYELAQAEWAAIHPRTRLESRSALQRLQAAYERRIGAASSARAYVLFERFTFVAELLGQRFRSLRVAANGYVTQMALGLVRREDLLAELDPGRVRAIVQRLAPEGAPPDAAQLDQLVELVATKADEVPAATLVSIVDIALGWLSRADASENSPMRGRVAELAQALVDRSFVDTPEFTGAYLGRLSTCRFMLPLEPDQESLLDEQIGDVASNLLRLDKWDAEASSGFARWVVDAASLEDVQRWLGGERGFATRLAADMTDALRRADIRRFSLLIRGLARLQAGAAASVLVDDLRTSASADQSAIVLGAAVLGRALDDVGGADALRGELFDACRAALEVIFSEAGAQRLSPGMTATFEHLAGVLFATRSSGRDLSSRTIRRVQVEYLRLALGAVRGGQAVAAADPLERALGWGEVTAAQANEVGAGLDASLDLALQNILSLRSEKLRTSPVLQKLREALCAAAFSRCEEVEDREQLLRELVRCCEAWRGEPPRSPALVRRLREVVHAFAADGDWARLVDAWRVVCRCQQVGLTQGVALPTPDPRLKLIGYDTELVGRLVDSSAMASEDGWPASAAAAALSDLEQIEGVAADACLALRAELAGQLVQRFRLTRGRASDPRRREFVCAVAVGLLAGVELPAIDCGEALASVFVADLLDGGADADLDMVVRSVPSAYEEAFSARVAKLLADVRFGPGDCAVMLASVARSSRPEQYRAAVRTMCERPCLLSIAELLRALEPAKESACWDRELASKLFAWLAPRVYGEVDRLSGPGFESSALEVLSNLLEVTTRVAANAAAEDDHRSFLAGAGDVMQKRLGDMSPERLRSLDDGLRQFPLISVRISAVRVLTAARRGAWAEAVDAAGKIGDRELRGRLEEFVAAAPRMEWIKVRGEELLLRRDEVSVAEYTQFIEAMRRDPEALARLAAGAGLGDGVVVEDLVPGATRADLREPDMPVHKINWLGARLYAAWVGMELPTIAAYRAAWGKDLYPWGDEWSSVNSNSAERYAAGGRVTLGAVSAASSSGGARATEGVFLHLHGNVEEYAADTSPLKEVTVLGSSAWSQGKKVTRGSLATRFAERGARSERRTGVGFRTMMRLPKLK